MKKLVALCLSLLLTLTLTAPAAAAGKDDGVKVQVNGRLVDFPDAAPEVVDGRTMVPLRAVLEALGAEVDYDAASQTTRAKLGGVSLSRPGADHGHGVLRPAGQCHGACALLLPGPGL